MKSVKYGAALLLFAVADQAHATQYAWCEIIEGRRMPERGIIHRTAIIEISEDPEATYLLSRGPFARGFLASLNLHRNYGLNSVECHSRTSLYKAEDSFKSAIYANRDSYVYNDTGWLGGRPSAVDRKDPPRVDTEGLIVTAPGQTVAPAAPRSDSAAAKKQWEIDYEAKMAEYNRKMDEHRKSVAETRRLEDEWQRMKAEQAERARKAEAEWRKRGAECRSGNHGSCVTPQ